MTGTSVKDIQAEATRWVLRIDRDGRSPQLDAEIENWIGDDMRRRGALLQAEAAWTLIDDAITGSEQDLAYGGGMQPRLSRRRLLAGAATGLAASLVAGVYALWHGTRYETALGEIRRVPLADGSLAAINSDTRVAVEIEKRARTAVLEKGEAWFQVAKDLSRPFTVEAGRVRVQAVGTAFSVRRRADGADVLVTEGLVEAWAAGAEGHRIRIAAGERAFVADDSAIRREPPSAAEIDRALAWRSGRIDLAGETLDHAVAEFNRYNARKLVIANSALGGERLYGVFKADDPESFASSIAMGSNFRISQSDPDRIVIDAR